MTILLSFVVVLRFVVKCHRIIAGSNKSTCCHLHSSSHSGVARLKLQEVFSPTICSQLFYHHTQHFVPSLSKIGSLLVLSTWFSHGHSLNSRQICRNQVHRTNNVWTGPLNFNWCGSNQIYKIGMPPNRISARKIFSYFRNRQVCEKSIL